MAIIKDTSFQTSKAEEANSEEKGETSEEEDTKSIKEVEDKELEDMNKANQAFSCENFKKVMHMVGRIILNLGLIYFFQFFCVMKKKFLFL